MAIITINVDESLLRIIDDAVLRLGYRSRSELIREAVKTFLSAPTEKSGIVVVLVVSNHSVEPRVDQRVIASAYRYSEEIMGLYHVTMERDRCLTAIIVRNKETLRPLVRSIRGIRGVEKVHVVEI